MQDLERFLNKLSEFVEISEVDFFFLDIPDDTVTIRCRVGLDHMNISVRAQKNSGVIVVFPNRLATINNFGISIECISEILKILMKHQTISFMAQENKVNRFKYKVSGLYF